ncbi:hypothetical protein GKZ90_0011435 [Flavobacterium sp. MC2016-06]|jgi:hypothetical protein|uniref:hypothetical protein n=1 Tax=Flavobacterium sp. MC2016-06 TaxID=2676308 RepID=UPI0012BAF96D|nr:hypothetical protein [Flavobacterium sp. MC2016-06]MBU3858714.1 hypothetical protein [Flavobacterium sp. MC2016-06]
MRKTTLLLAVLCTTALIYVSCSSNDDNGTANLADVASVGASVTIDATNEMDVNTGLSVAANSATSKTTDSPAGVCATITVSGTTYPRVFTLDYGTSGCTDSQLTRKGKLKITLSGPVTTTGSKMTIERIDYSINGIKLEGTIEYTNTTTVATVPQWNRRVINGKLTDLQGNVYTNSGMYTTKQTAGVDTPFVLTDNVYEITEGTHTVTASGGGTLTLTVAETLIKKYSCTFISKGKLKVESNLINGVIDYGNNDCDSNYTFTNQSGLVYNLVM